ncbi:MAG TPA: hypothetical protein VIY90_05250 [Steroidobacteraceae bacterium]
MIWHFFRKDVRLLWPLALAVVVTQALCALRTAALGYFDQPPVLERLTSFLPLLVYLGIAIVAVTVVHQEPLSGAQEDWLVRPIRRRDLALSKVLFVLLMVNLPLMLVDLAQQLALHFSVSASITAALSRFLIMMFGLSLPALVLGAVTRSLIDAFVFAVPAAIGFVFFTMFATTALSPDLFEIAGGGITWVTVAAASLVVSLGSAAALAFQYLTRRTLMARGIGLAAVLAALCTLMFLPRTVAIAAQEAVSALPSRNAVRLSFDAARQAAHSGAESAPSVGFGSAVPGAVVVARAMEQARLDRQMQQIRLPLSIVGLQQGDILFADRVTIRVTALTGRVLYQGARVCTHGSLGYGIGCVANRLEVWSSTAQSFNIRSEQRLMLPMAVYERIKDLPVRVEVMYVLTRFAPQPSQAISAVGDLQSLPEMGTCATRIDEDGDEIELGCLTDVGVPSCAAVILEDPQTNRRNPALHLCNPSYGPAHRLGSEDAVNRSHLSIPFQDPSGLAHYPVDSAAIKRARLVVTAYDPAAHFHSTLTIPSIRLVQWSLPNG